ncbi:hypothetical protein ANTQUA_LOCUS3219 [Anthophora quadrimaculata]
MVENSFHSVPTAKEEQKRQRWSEKEKAEKPHALRGISPENKVATTKPPDSEIEGGESEEVGLSWVGWRKQEPGCSSGETVLPHP